MPHPRIDWMNSKYYGHIVDSNGKPIQDALVIVKNNNRRKSVVQVTQTDKNGEYEIKAKKTFMIFGALACLLNVLMNYMLSTLYIMSTSKINLMEENTLIESAQV